MDELKGQKSSRSIQTHFGQDSQRARAFDAQPQRQRRFGHQTGLDLSDMVEQQSGRM